MATTPNMALTTWGPNDYFNDLELKTNWERIDLHDHDPDNDGGVRIDTNGIVDAAINNLKLADDAVTNDKILDGTITRFKLANDLLIALEAAADALTVDTTFGSATTSNISGTYDNLKLKDASIVNTHIASGAQIAVNKLDIPTQSKQSLSNSNKAIDAAAQAAGDVTGTFSSMVIAPTSVDTGKLALGAVQNDRIRDGAVNSAKIENGSIATVDIGNNQVTAAKTANDEAWVVYNMSISAIGNTPVIGSGTAVSTKYKVVHKTVFVQIVIKVGGGNFGSSGQVWTFGLPFASTGVALGNWAVRWHNGVYYSGVVCAGPMSGTTLGSTQMVFHATPSGSGGGGFLGAGFGTYYGYWYEGAEFSAHLQYELP